MAFGCLYGQDAGCGSGLLRTEVIPMLDRISGVAAVHNPVGAQSRDLAGPRAESEPPTERDITEGLFGRGDFLRSLSPLLEEAEAGEGFGLLVRGETGSGKSALLDHAARLAGERGWQVIRIGGVRREASLPFAGLYSLVGPLAETVAATTGFSEALGRAVAGEVDGPGRSLDVYLEMLDVLDIAATEQPVLVVADDCQWMDEESARGLIFMSRRTTQKRIGLLAAVRAEDRDVFVGWQAAEHKVTGLDEESASKALDIWHPELAPTIRSRVLKVAEGNPLALKELPLSLSSDQRAGREPVPDPLPIGPRLLRVLGPRIQVLPEATRTLLGVAAATEGPRSLRTVLAAAQDLRIEPGALTSAEQAGLIRISGAELSFTTALHRSTAYWSASNAQRWLVHAALGRVLAGAKGPLDEEALAGLDQVAALASRQGRPAAAAHALQRAAELTTDPGNRSTRYADSAAQAVLAGRPVLAQTLLHQVEPEVLGPQARAAIEAVSVWTSVESARGPGVTERTVVQALRRVLDSDSRLGQDALFLLAQLTSLSGHEEFAAEARRCVHGRRQPNSALRAAVAARIDPVDQASKVRQETAEFHEGREASLSALSIAELTWLADAAWSVESLDRARRLVGLVLLRGRGTESVDIDHCRVLQASLHLARGQWTELLNDVPLLVREAEEHGRHRQAMDLSALALMVHAYRGQSESAAVLGTQLRGWAQSNQSQLHADMADHATGVLALGRDDHRTAHEVLSRLCPPGGPARCRTAAHRALLDIVDAALRRGDLGLARRCLRWAEARGVEAASAPMALRVRHARALLAAHLDQQDVEEHFREALTVTHLDIRPVDLARVRLDYGAWLRRQRRQSEACAQLRAALTTLERLGARPWIDKARKELRAAGVSVVSYAQPTTSELSPQERRIAELAASGLSNREIGDQLRLSPRTVGSYLYQVFPRLGIRSRRELAHALKPASSGGAPVPMRRSAHSSEMSIPDRRSADSDRVRRRAVV
jgi:DNA-binding CsgD family transcriptional regulator